MSTATKGGLRLHKMCFEFKARSSKDEKARYKGWDVVEGNHVVFCTRKLLSKRSTLKKGIKVIALGHRFPLELKSQG